MLNHGLSSSLSLLKGSNEGAFGMLKIQNAPPLEHRYTLKIHNKYVALQGSYELQGDMC